MASKKIGKAVVRNRARRLLRAVFLNAKDNLQSGIYIFIAKKQIIDAEFTQIQKSLNWSFRKIGCLK